LTALSHLHFSSPYFYSDADTKSQGGHAFLSLHYHAYHLIEKPWSSLVKIMCETLKIKKYKHASSNLEKKTIFYIKPMISIYEESYDWEELSHLNTPLSIPYYSMWDMSTP
jgi:hypothetical protein